VSSAARCDGWWGDCREEAHQDSSSSVLQVDSSGGGSSASPPPVEDAARPEPARTGGCDDYRPQRQRSRYVLGELLRQPSPEHAAPAGKECTGGGASPAAEPMSERPSQCHRETCIAPRARPRPRTLTIRTPACAGSWRWGIACPRAEFQLEYAAATVLVRLLPAVAPPPVAPRGARRPALAFGAMLQRLTLWF